MSWIEVAIVVIVTMLNQTVLFPKSETSEAYNGMDIRFY